MYESNVFIDLKENKISYGMRDADPWKIQIVDTGLETQTGGRLKRVREFVGDDTFCLTYGDGVSNVDMAQLFAFHRAHGRRATVTAIQPPARFGAISFDGDRVASFDEKPAGDGQWINGGFFVLEPAVFDVIEGDSTIWEHEPLRALATTQQLMAFRHGGFWSAMDTLRDRMHLEKLWASGQAPWKLWA